MQEDIILTVKKIHKENHAKFLDESCETFIQTEARLAFLVNKDTISIHAEGDRTYILDKDVCLAILNKVNS